MQILAVEDTTQVTGGLGVESAELARALGVRYVYSLHMTLSYSRDPFCCFTTAVDLATFWGAHVRAFAHFGGVPASIVYDRTKTVVNGTWLRARGAAASGGDRFR